MAAIRPRGTGYDGGPSAEPESYLDPEATVRFGGRTYKLHAAAGSLVLGACPDRIADTIRRQMQDEDPSSH